MEKFLIPESKCQRLGKDSDVLKINIWHGPKKKNEGGGKEEVVPKGLPEGCILKDASGSVLSPVSV